MAKKYLSVILILVFIVVSTRLSFGQRTTTDKRIVINIAARTLTLFNENNVEKIYPVAVGRPSRSTQTPRGNFKILNKIVNPYYRKLKIPGGSLSNPLGVRWLGFKANYGIHGNSNPKSIGTTASAGCIRMYNYDVKELYEKVFVNTKVDIIYSLFHIYQENDEGPSVLMIYPDVYRTEKNLEKTIADKLNKENIKDGIEDIGIQEAVKHLKDRTVALSQQWVLLINGHDLITDIITENEKVYIDSLVLKEYFGLTMDKDSDGSGKILEKAIESKNFNEKTYFSMEDIKNLVGGRIEKNSIIKNIWYDVSFLKLNGVYLEENHSVMATHNPMVPVKVLSEVLGQEASMLSNPQWIQKTPYMYLEELQKVTEIGYHFNSYNKQIELFKKPTIYLENKILPVKSEKDRNLINLADLEVNSLVSNDQWIELNDLETKYDILYDKYKLNVHLIPKSQDEIEAEVFEETCILQ